LVQKKVCLFFHSKVTTFFHSYTTNTAVGEGSPERQRIHLEFISMIMELEDEGEVIVVVSQETTSSEEYINRVSQLSKLN